MSAGAEKFATGMQNMDDTMFELVRAVRYCENATEFTRLRIDSSRTRTHARISTTNRFPCTYATRSYHWPRTYPHYCARLSTPTTPPLLLCYATCERAMPLIQQTSCSILCRSAGGVTSADRGYISCRSAIFVYNSIHQVVGTAGGKSVTYRVARQTLFARNNLAVNSPRLL